MTGKGARQKGYAYERAVAKDLRGIFGEDAGIRRGLQSQGNHCPDVIVDGWHVECKIGKKQNIRAALAQAVRDEAIYTGGTGEFIPVAVVKDDRKEAMVTMRYSDWLEMVHRLHHGEADV